MDQASTWQSFAVLAAADGKAMVSSGGGYGDFVLIWHPEQDEKGRHYFTLYSHLASTEPHIIQRADRFAQDYTNWTPVKRGDQIGIAGATGVNNTTWIHLHFEVNQGAYAQNKLDPYDIYKTRDYYPQGHHYTRCGPNSLWLNDPLNEIEKLRNFKLGDSLRVVRTGGIGLRLRTQPSISAPVIVVMPEGSKVEVVGGPQRAEGHDWWQISYLHHQGWAAGKYLVNSEDFSPPYSPFQLEQYCQEGTAIGVGETLHSNRIVLKARLDDPTGERVKLQVEVRPSSESFRQVTHVSGLMQSGFQATVTVPGLTNGNYHWRARTVTASGMTSDWVEFSKSSSHFTVTIQSRPTAIINHHPIQPIPGETIRFHATSSTPNSEIVSYYWNFGEGVTQTGIEVSHRYHTTGDHQVALTVTSKDGLTHTTTTEVRVVSKELVDAINELVDRTIVHLKGTDETSVLNVSKKLANAVQYFGNNLEKGKWKILINAFSSIFSTALSGYLSSVYKDSSLIQNTVHKIFNNNSIDGALEMLKEKDIKLLDAMLISMINSTIKSGDSVVLDQLSDNNRYNVESLINLSIVSDFNDIENELNALRKDLLQNLPALTPEESIKISNNLKERRLGNVGLNLFYSRKSHTPITYAQLKKSTEDSREAKLFNFAKAALFAYISCKLGQFGLFIKLIPAGASFSWSHIDILQGLSIDEIMFDFALDGLVDTAITKQYMVENTKNGLKQVETSTNSITNDFYTPQGKIVSANSFTEGGFRLFNRNWRTNKAYIDVNIVNTGSEKTEYILFSCFRETFPTVAFQYYCIDVLSSEPPITLHPGEEKNVKFVYYDRHAGGGFIPKEDVFFYLMSKTEDGFYLNSTVNTKFGTTYITEDGKVLSDEEKKDLVMIEYPIHSALYPINTQGKVTGDFSLTITITNPFEQSIMATLEQTLPSHVEALRVNEGVVQNNQILWDVNLFPGESRTFKVLFRPTQDLPSQWPEATFKVYDTQADQWETFASSAQMSQLAIADSNLQTALERSLGKSPNTLTYYEMARQLRISAAKQNIVSLGGIEYAYNLQELDLSQNNIASLFSLRGMTKLHTLNLSRNLLQTIYGIEELPHLNHLDLSHNQLTDITTLIELHQNGGLAAGSYLNLEGNDLDYSEGSDALRDVRYLLQQGVRVQADKQKRFDRVPDATSEIIIHLQIGNAIAHIEKEGKKEQIRIDVPPQIIQERTMVPLRFIAESFGSEVEWIATSKSIRIVLHDTTILMQIGNPIVHINDRQQRIDVPPTIRNERTLVPLRFIAEAFGSEVEWFPHTKEIKITYQKK